MKMLRELNLLTVHLIFSLEVNKMKPYSPSLRTGFYNFSLTHAVLKKVRKFLVSPILSFAVLVVPALTNAGPEALAKAKNCFSCIRFRLSE